MSSNLLEAMLLDSNFGSSSESVLSGRKNSDKILSISKKENSHVSDNTEDKDSSIYQAVDMLRAKDSASFDDFISMTSKLICLTMDHLPYEVMFLPQDNQDRIVDPEVKTDKVFITYNLVSRVPLREIKPMPREEIVEQCDVSGEERRGTIYGQKYTCEVQFNIFASEYKIANEVMKMFEDMLFTFTGYMKEKGISNILFKQQFTDTDFNIYRKSMSVRNLRYHIETENLLVILSDTVSQVVATGSL